MIGMAEKLGFDDDGHLVEVTEFPYDEVRGFENRLERDLTGSAAQSELESLTAEEVEAGLKLFRALVRWMWQDGMKNPNGLLIRSIIVCWIFCEELHGHKLTEVANGFGRFKQSLGRWVDRFKVEFPYIRTPHMKPPKRKGRQCMS